MLLIFKYCPVNVQALSILHSAWEYLSDYGTSSALCNFTSKSFTFLFKTVK